MRRDLRQTQLVAHRPPLLTVDLSNLMPQFDTSSNSIPGLDKAFQEVTQQLDGILETLKKGGLVKVDADVNTSTGAVGIKFDAAGIA